MQYSYQLFKMHEIYFITNFNEESTLKKGNFGIHFLALLIIKSGPFIDWGALMNYFYCIFNTYHIGVPE